jgi:hypothetical protein
MGLFRVVTLRSATSPRQRDSETYGMEKGINQWERWFWRSEIKVKCGHYHSKLILSKRSPKGKAFCDHPNFLHNMKGVPVVCEGDKWRCDIPLGKRIV